MSHLPANWLTPEPPKPPRRPRNSIIPALITVGCAFVLLGGSAFGALSTCSYSGNNRWFGFFAGATMFLVVAFVLALVWLLVAVIVAFFRRSKEDYDKFTC
jgi:preprotein translocase subunit SecG